MFARPSYWAMPDSEELTTVPCRQWAKLVPAVSVVREEPGRAGAVGAKVRVFLEEALPVLPEVGGALRRGSSIAAGEISPRTSNTTLLSLRTRMVLASTHVLKNG